MGASKIEEECVPVRSVAVWVSKFDVVFVAMEFRLESVSPQKSILALDFGKVQKRRLLLPQVDIDPLFLVGDVLRKLE